MQVKIIKMGINGEGIGYIDNKPVFIKGALIDEVVDIEITKKENNYSVGELKKIITKSKYRIVPKCKIQHLCGGCPLMILSLKKQGEYKRDTLVETLIKYAGIESKYVSNTVVNPTPLRYRNQFKLPCKIIKDKLYCGMYGAESNRIITFDDCVIHDVKLEEIRKQVMVILNKYGIKDYYDKVQRGLRHIVLRGFDNNYQLTLVTGKQTIDEALIKELSAINGIKSIFQNVNVQDTHEIFSNDFRCLFGPKTIELKLENIVLRLSSAAFFQLNLAQAKQIYKQVIDFVDESDLIVEAYCGIGAMSLMLGNKAKKVIGIEWVKDAVKNANENAKFNHLDDTVSFICGDAGKEMKLIASKETIDTVIVDPPRIGLDKTMIQALIKSKPRKIIYVSCNPSTLAKNLNDLKEAYDVQKIIPYDLFTHTPHVESITLLTLREFY